MDRPQAVSDDLKIALDNMKTQSAFGVITDPPLTRWIVPVIGSRWIYDRLRRHSAMLADWFESRSHRQIHAITLTFDCSIAQANRSLSRLPTKRRMSSFTSANRLISSLVPGFAYFAFSDVLDLLGDPLFARRGVV